MEQQKYLWVGFKNVLVQYQGGGYTGCFWEWNAAYFNEDGEFHSLHASGRDGCETLETLENIEERGYCQEVHCVDLDDQKAVDEFAKEINATFIHACAITLAKKFQIGLEAPCPVCGIRVALDDDIALINEQGEGGLAYSAHDWICNDCYNERSCSYCGEYFGKDYTEYMVEDDQHGQICKDCARQLTREHAEKKMEYDLREWTNSVDQFNVTEFKNGCPVEKEGE